MERFLREVDADEHLHMIGLLLRGTTHRLHAYAGIVVLQPFAVRCEFSDLPREDEEFPVVVADTFFEVFDVHGVSILYVPNVVAGLAAEEGEEAMADGGAQEADDGIDDHGEFEVVDADCKPCEPQGERGARSVWAKLCEDEFIRDPEEVKPLRIHGEQQQQAPPPEGMVEEVVEVDEGCREECRNFRVVHHDDECLPEARWHEETFTKEAEGDHICCEPVEVDELKEEEDRRDDEVGDVMSFVPLPKCPDPLHEQSIDDFALGACGFSW